MQEQINITLKFLFDAYLKSPGAMIGIASSLEPSFSDQVHVIGKHLHTYSYVENPQYRTNDFLCSITMLGIENINSIFIAQYRASLLSILKFAGAEGDLMEILDLQPKQYIIGRDLACHWQTQGLIDVEFQGASVFITLTPQGEQVYNQNKAYFFD